MKNKFILSLIAILLGSASVFAQRELNPTELELRNRLRQASSIVAELMKDEAAKKVVLAGVRSGYYADESILFRDLLNPAASPAYKSMSKIIFLANMKVFFSHTSFLFFAVISPITTAKSALSG